MLQIRSAVVGREVKGATMTLKMIANARNAIWRLSVKNRLWDPYFKCPISVAFKQIQGLYPVKDDGSAKN